MLSLIAVCTTLAFAAPTTLVHEGRLLDPAGGPIEGGVAATFALYPSESAATPVWSEDQSLTIQDGYYAAVLGNVVELESAILASGMPLWLGIELDEADLGRQALHSVPYAVHARQSVTLSRTDCAPGQVLAFDDADAWSCATVGGALGDVKWSVLGDDAFATENGPGWVRWVGQSLSGTDLGALTGLTTLPDPTGRFVRAIGDSGRAPLSVEAFATASTGLSVTVASGGVHSHSASTNNAGNHSHTMGVNGTDTFSMTPGGATQRLAHFRSDGFGGGGAKSTNGAGTHSHTVSVADAGGHAHTASIGSLASETRPNNVALHLYVKVNR